FCILASSAAVNPISAASAKCTPLPKTIGVAAGKNTAYAWNLSGEAFSWGRGDKGQRGDGTTSYSKNKPQDIKAVKYVHKISSYGATALILQRDGLVYSVGSNTFGQLGLGSKQNYSIPQKVKSLSCVIDIAAGPDTSYAVKADGSVWGWGYNADDELNIGNSWPALTPKKIIGLSNIIAISASEYNLLALSSNGSVFALGDNFDGQLGTGDTEDPNRYPVKVKGLALKPKSIAIYGETSGAVQQDGSVVLWGSPGRVYAADDSILSPQTVPLAGQAKSIVLGSWHALVIDKSNNLWTWGSNRKGALGLGLDEFCYFSDEQSCEGYDASGFYFHINYTPTIVLRNVSSVAAGDEFTVAVQKDGTTWAWGSGTSGQLGNGYGFNRTKPSKVFFLKLNK
ncbi:MAG: RCC1 domain-containing protein, partial [Rhodoluna sp.]